MVSSKKKGDKEILEPFEMPESTQKLLTEVLAQNRIILEENCRIIRLIGSPVMLIPLEGKHERFGMDGYYRGTGDA